MKKKGFDWRALTSAIHLIAVLSAVCFGTIYLTLGILTLPALTSAFLVGKDVIYKRFDVYDSLAKRFFRQLKEEMGMMRYFPLQLIIIVQLLGMYAAGRVGMLPLAYVLLPCMAFLMTLVIYIIAYHVFYEKKPDVIRVIIAMFYRVQYLMTIWVLMILVSILFQTSMLGILLIIGEVFLLLLEAAAFLGITAYKRAKGDLNDDDREHFDEDFFNKI
ncbi:MAG: hypothetical protein K2K57_10890 [Oscillospiraceae bacterium]|nr:hypothetical protein [Oscillospiraceae bacterium]